MYVQILTCQLTCLSREYSGLGESATRIAIPGICACVIHKGYGLAI